MKTPVQVISTDETTFYDFTTAPGVGDILDLGHGRALRVYARMIRHDPEGEDYITIKVTDA